MKAILLVTGKTDLKTIDALILDYINRIKHYFSFELQVLPDVKNTKKYSSDQLKSAEAVPILKNIREQDCVVLLDEKGAENSSVDFSKFINVRLQEGKRIVFVIGGPFGFDESVYKRAQYRISLSKMTFSHQMVRLIFLEQLYRAMTIIRGEKYHHE